MPSLLKSTITKVPLKPAPTKPAKAPLETKIDVPVFNGDGLPAAPTKSVVDPASLRYLFVAPPGFGKTTTFTNFPDSLLLACEEGHKFVEGYKIVIDGWDETEEFTDADGIQHMSFCRAADLIEGSERFQFIIVDTLDALIKLCVDFHNKKGKVTHISELGDFGKGYDIAQNTPIRQGITKILKTGRGLGLITHQDVTTKSFTGGAKSKKETTLPNGIHKLVFPQMDVILHGEYGGIREGNNYKDRIIRTAGSEDILAKNRGGIFPNAFIMPPEREDQVKMLEGFFDPEKGKENIEAAWTEFTEFYGG